MSGSNYFSVWKGRYAEKSAILTNAAAVIHKHSLRTYTCVLPMKDYAQVNNEVQLSEMVGTPYSLLVRCSWEMVKDWRYRTGFAAPVAMIIEARKNGGDVNEVFLRDNQPVPQTGSKTICALQAADYIAWMRQQRIKPSGGYAHVRDSWRQIGSLLHDDFVIDRSKMLRFYDGAEEEGNGPAPTRDQYPDIQVRFRNNPKRARPQFKPKRLATTD